MLIKEGAESVSKLDYPNFWHQGNLKLRLTYQFERGRRGRRDRSYSAAAVKPVDESGFEWQIPGLRRELVIALIKSLPKPVRRNFVPAPNYAEAFLGRVTPLELPLLDALEREFRRMTGTTIDRDDWNWDQVPDHLKITFRVVDDKTKAAGRPLAFGTEGRPEGQSAGNPVCRGGRRYRAERAAHLELWSASGKL